MDNLSSNTNILGKMLKKHTTLCKLYCSKWKQNYNRRQHERFGSNSLAEKENRRIETDRICKSIFIRYGKEVRNERTGTVSSSLGIGTFQTTYLRKANWVNNRSKSAGTAHQKKQVKRNLQRKNNKIVSSFGSFRYKYRTHRRKTFSANGLFEQKSNIKTRAYWKLRRRVRN